MSITFLIAGIVFAGSALIALFVGKLRHGFTKYVASVSTFLSLLLASVAYAAFYTEASLYSRGFDGQELHAVRFLFEAVAAALLTAGMAVCASYGCYEVALISITTFLWGLLLFLGSNAQKQGGVIAGLVFAAILALYSFYLLWKGSFIRSTYYTCMRWAYVLFVVLLHLGYLLGQPGLGVLGSLGNAIWFAVNDFLLYVLLGFAVIYCPQCCNIVSDINACCQKCQRSHAYTDPCSSSSRSCPSPDQYTQPSQTTTTTRFNTDVLPMLEDFKIQ